MTRYHCACCNIVCAPSASADDRRPDSNGDPAAHAAQVRHALGLDATDSADGADGAGPAAASPPHSASARSSAPASRQASQQPASADGAEAALMIRDNAPLLDPSNWDRVILTDADAIHIRYAELAKTLPIRHGRALVVACLFCRTPVFATASRPMTVAESTLDAKTLLRDRADLSRPVALYNGLVATEVAVDADGVVPATPQYAAALHLVVPDDVQRNPHMTPAGRQAAEAALAHAVTQYKATLTQAMRADIEQYRMQQEARLEQQFRQAGQDYRRALRVLMALAPDVVAASLADPGSAPPLPASTTAAAAAAAPVDRPSSSPYATRSSGAAGVSSTSGSSAATGGLSNLAPTSALSSSLKHGSFLNLANAGFKSASVSSSDLEQETESVSRSPRGPGLRGTRGDDDDNDDDDNDDEDDEDEDDEDDEHDGADPRSARSRPRSGEPMLRSGSSTTAVSPALARASPRVLTAALPSTTLPRKVHFAPVEPAAVTVAPPPAAAPAITPLPATAFAAASPADVLPPAPDDLPEPDTHHQEPLFHVDGFESPADAAIDSESDEDDEDDDNDDRAGHLEGDGDDGDDAAVSQLSSSAPMRIPPRWVTPRAQATAAAGGAVAPDGSILPPGDGAAAAPSDADAVATPTALDPASSPEFMAPHIYSASQRPHELQFPPPRRPPPVDM
ncbi:hypothetical protein CXG81DRAFT_28202 [Caulochytrium protostelioides]|uniref:Uncharacterized protein n=1 Tax=Caulochytrium protostelioides TaxID=1555241 RepID=A0A4P9WZK3_9FUNG|nr:hypothetical protein CXG81DRAFT_28202 [Caulochytrium protostelioides]|eukprot:RKO99009.1 hypothetical protein CXG81DRAFT_28202 [Caulochytrium protostelioides]